MCNLPLNNWAAARKESVWRALTSRLPLFLNALKYLVSKWIRCKQEKKRKKEKNSPFNDFVIATVNIGHKCREAQTALMMTERERRERTPKRKNEMRAKHPGPVSPVRNCFLPSSPCLQKEKTSYANAICCWFWSRKTGQDVSQQLSTLSSKCMALRRVTNATEINRKINLTMWGFRGEFWESLYIIWLTLRMRKSGSPNS